MIAWLAKRLPQGRIAQSIMMLMGGTALSQLITAMSMPFVSRLYAPELIGLVSIFLVFFNFWVTTLAWRYDGALLVAADEREAHHVFRLGLLIVGIMSLVAVPALYLLNIYGVLGFGGLPAWSVLAMFLALLGYGAFMMYRSWALRLGAVRSISHATILRSAANAGVRLSTGAAGVGVAGLFAAEVIGFWAALGMLRREARLRDDVEAPFWSISALRFVARRYEKFPRYELPSVMVNQMAIALPLPMIASLYGTAAAGFYGFARLLVAMPNGQVGAAVADVFQMESAKHVRNGDAKAVRTLFYLLLKRLALLGLIPMAAAMALAPTFTQYIFGKDWAEMGLVIASIAPWMYASLVVSSLSRILSVLEAQRLKLIYDIFSASVVLASYWIAMSCDASMLDFLLILSAAMVLSYCIYLCVLVYVVERMNWRSKA